MWACRDAGLGHARLSVIDPSEDGRQPMGIAGGGLWIAFNGEIYNFQSLRQELLARGCTFRSQTDTEVILHLYRQEGIDCVNRLEGMFAFAIWDEVKGQLFLVRDRLGIKPLYYSSVGGRLIFGSEIKAILASGLVSRAVRPQALSDYLTFSYVPAPKTMFEGIFKLPPGHWLRLDRQGMMVRQYWDLPAVSGLDGSALELQRELAERLRRSVRGHMVSDVPIGAFLSGGLDSSAVVAMMAGAGQEPPVTFNIGFDQSSYDERPHARRVAQRYHTKHFEHVVRSDAVGIAQTLAWHYDEPFADYSAVPTYYVSKCAREHVTVALSGDGADEIFAGYRRYRFDLFERRMRRLLPGFLRHLLGPLARAYPQPSWLPRPLRAKTTLGNIAVDAPTAFCRSVAVLPDDAKPAMLSGDLAAALQGYRSDELIRDYMRQSGGGDLDQLLYVDAKTYLSDDILTKVDRASMAVSLEVRVPFLDHRMVEFARQVPAGMKIERGQGKAILKSAMSPHLDDQTLDRPKQGFTPPIAEWLGNDMREMMHDILDSPRAAWRDYLQPGAVATLQQDHVRGTRDNSRLLWAVLMFELWSENYLRGGDPSARRPSPVAASGGGGQGWPPPITGGTRI